MGASKQQRFCFRESVIHDRQHGTDYYLDDTVLHYCNEDKALCIFHKGKHIDSVFVHEDDYYDILFNFEITSQYIPPLIEQNITCCDERIWRVGKGVLCSDSGDEYTFDALTFEMAGEIVDIYQDDSTLCALDADNNAVLMQAIETFNKRKNTRLAFDDNQGSLEDKGVMVTTEMAVNLPIEARLGIISAQSAHGLNIIKDYFTGWSDKLGGRSSSIQNTLKEAQEEVIEELKREARTLGGNCIVAIDFDISQYSGGGKSMLFVVATGTALKLRRI